MPQVESLRSLKECPICGKIKTKKTKFCSTRCGQIYIKRLKRRAKKHPELLTQYRIATELEKVRKAIKKKLETLYRKIRYSINKKIYWQICNKRRGRWKKCRRCGKKFYAKRQVRSSVKYCSVRCQRLAMSKKQKARRGKYEKRRIWAAARRKERKWKLWWFENCLWCGRVFYLELAKDNAFCSRKCANNYWKNLDVIQKVMGIEVETEKE